MLKYFLLVLITVIFVLTSVVEAAKEVYRDDNAILQYQSNIDLKKTKWIVSLYSKGWAHVRKNFGYFGGGKAEGRLVGEFMADSDPGSMSGGRGIWVQDGGSNHVDVSIDENSLKSGNLYDSPKSPNKPKQDIIFEGQLENIAEIVQLGNNKVDGSPARNVWGRQGWMDIFVYDLFSNLHGYNKELKEWERKRANAKSEAKVAQGYVYWMRDWWTPIYAKYGKTRLLSKFFKIVAQYWPKQAGKVKGTFRYEEDSKMEVGHFVHFMSGAANKNLTSLAKKAFGWEEEDTDYYNMAVEKYPEIKYEN